MTMAAKKNLQEREKELRSLLVTESGREELQELAAKYSAASGELRPTGRSAVTYILVHERNQGLISG